MKKFFFILFLLIILGGAGFFLGWTNTTVPPGSFGVMRSKTHGLESQVIQSGEFRWIWYKMIPTNAEVSVFNISPVRRSIRSTGSLGSGQVFANLSGLSADFSWEITGELRFSLKPEILPELAGRENIRNDADLRRYEEDLAVRIETMALGRVMTLTNSGDEGAIESLVLTGTLPGLENDILRAFPEIENIHCVFRAVRLPDFDLYRALTALYRDYLERQNVALREDVLMDAQNRIGSRFRLDELSQYGEVLTRYPILLDFLAMDTGLTATLE